MNFFVSIVFVFICLFAGNARSGEYHPEPVIIPAVTEPLINGTWRVVSCRLYGSDGLDYCLTAAETDDWNTVGDNSVPYWDQCWTSDSHGACKKCSSMDLTRGTYNGSEVCIHDCPDTYQLGTYNGTDGCINCPVSYQFSNGACQWDGPGPPPPTPSPTTPAGLSASDGTSPVNVIIKWKRSKNTDHYILERAAGTEEPFIWWKIGKINDVLAHEYDDKSARVATWYTYRVKACNSDNQCSAYSNTDKGAKALETPDPVRVETPGDNPTWVKVSWSSVPAADGYLVLVAKKKNSYFARFGFAYTDDQVLTYNGEKVLWTFLFRADRNERNDIKFNESDWRFSRLKEKDHAVFVIAFKRDDSGVFLSYPAVWNSSFPVYPSVRLLLFGD